MRLNDESLGNIRYRSFMKNLNLLSILLSVCIFACSDDNASNDSGIVGHDSQVIDAKIPVDTLKPDLNYGPIVKVKLATFNVHNFFDSTDDPEKDDEVLSENEVAIKIAQLGTALRKLDADIVALQEIETLDVLKKLVNEELSSEGYDHVYLQSGNDPRGINVALLSRYKVLSVTSHSGDHFPGIDPSDSNSYWFSRDCLEVAIETSENRKLIVLINHLRAYDYSEPELANTIRYAQAQRVRSIVDSILKWEPSANIAVVGDFNDEPASKTLSLVMSGDAPLYDPLSPLTLNERYTYYYKGDKKQIDYILVSPSLKAGYVSGSAYVSHSTTFSDTSDHYPVAASFNVK